MKKLFTTLAVALATLTVNAQPVLLHEFGNTNDGVKQQSPLFSDGTYLYGTTSLGGTNDLGTIYKVKPDGTGYVKLFDFDGTTSGNTPYGAVFSDGTYLYGMTALGGASSNVGVLYKIKNDGTGYTKLLEFGTVAVTGSSPSGALISDGTFLYGMTQGTIFKVKPDGTGYLLLHAFDGTHGNKPYGSLISDGTFLYGTTSDGGTSGSDPIGTIFKIKPDGTSFSLIYEFTGTNGSHPYCDLYSDGTFLYGTTYDGGANSLGTIFKIMPDGTGYTRLLDFNLSNGAHSCYGALVSVGGFLYGTTLDGGSHNLGIVYKIKTDGTGFADLYDFEVSHGARPQANFIAIGTDLYSNTFSGGINSGGVVYKFDASAVGVHQANMQEMVNVYPNPAGNKFSVEIPGKLSTNFELEIYNAAGQIVYTNTKFNQQVSNEVDLSGFAKGTYFVKISDGITNYKTKIIVQ